MHNLQSDINRVVDTFVSQISELARRAAIDTLSASLGSKGKVNTNGFIGRGTKRRSDDIEKTASLFREFVEKHPGLRIEQINKQLGTSTKDLALPIKKLIADKQIKVKGSRRATTYFAEETARIRVKTAKKN
jgi:hypothetical protein